MNYASVNLSINNKNYNPGFHYQDLITGSDNEVYYTNYRYNMFLSQKQNLEKRKKKIEWNALNRQHFYISDSEQELNW